MSDELLERLHHWEKEGSRHKGGRFSSDKTRLEHALNQFRVVHPYEFLENEVGVKTSVTPPLHVLQAFRKVEQLMDYETTREYNKFVKCICEALDLCCPTRLPMGPHVPDSYTPRTPLKCVDVRGSLARTRDRVAREPDLFIGFDTTVAKELSTPECGDNVRFSGGLDTIHATHGIPVFIFTAYRDNSSDDSSEDTEAGLASNDTSDRVLAEMLNYLFAYPWYYYPQRFTYCISIIETKLRLWKWEIDSCVATKPIAYTQNPLVLYRLLQLVGQLPYSGLGVDIGAHQIFKPVVMTEEDRLTMEDMIELYHDSCSSSTFVDEWEKEALERCTLCMLRGWDVFESDRSIREQHIKTNIVVLSHPIYNNSSPLSKNTRCYLALPQSQFESFSEEDRDISYVNVLKTNWTPISQVPELTYYRLARERVGSIDQLATVLAGGFMSPFKTYLRMWNRFWKTGDGKRGDHKRKVGGSQFNWTLIKEVGESFEFSANRSGEMLLATKSIAIGLRNLFEAKILHRNISPTNIMINLFNRNGFVIDLASAADQSGGASNDIQHDDKDMKWIMGHYNELTRKNPFPPQFTIEW
ncbi:hypothetical protein FRC17_006971 [Serendipita sp. 399]|nr:hypothetical protein FRC17_006971 [Serendipita sp. 399]